MRKNRTENCFKALLFVICISIVAGCAPAAVGETEEIKESVDDTGSVAVVVADYDEGAGSMEGVKRVNGVSSVEGSETIDQDALLESIYGDMPFSDLKTGDESVSLGKGMNIGNALEAPKGVSWGVEMKAEYFDYIRDAGFDTVRLPVRFSDYTSGEGDTLDEAFMKRIDCYIKYALLKDLNLVLDLHHFNELYEEPENNRSKFLNIWRQLAERYKDSPKELVFEVLNEPTDKLYGDVLNSLIRDVVSVIRETNPERLVIVGPERFSSVEGFDTLELPEDENLMVTFHYYVPNDFAFQGNEYHEGYEHLSSVKWTASDEEIAKLRTDFEKVRDWASERGVGVFLGEFGVVKTVSPEYRNLWIEKVARMAEEMGFSWSYWELCSHFGVFDSESCEWDDGALDVLIS